jgi:RNA polymerase sigma-70 factor (ECF subfamily)
MLIVSYRDDEVGAHHPLRSVIGDLPGALLTRLCLPSLSESAVQAMATRSCEEIAEIMDCPVNTVKSRMFHARIKMRALLPKLAGTASIQRSTGED